MGRRASGILLSVALAVPAAAAVPNPKEDWIEVRTENFLLISDASESLTRGVGLSLERLRKSLSLLLKMDVRSPVPSSIYVFKGTRSFRRYVDPGERSRIGLFIGHPDGNFVAIDCAPDVDPYDVVFHEYLHFYVHNNSDEPVPTWFDEGLAEFYSTFEAEENQVAIGKPLAHHVQALRSRRWLPLEQLFSITPDAADYNEGERSSLFYAESWILVHYLLSGNPERTPQIRAFLEAVARGSAVPDAFRESFGIPTEELLREVRRYLENDCCPYIRYTFKDLAISEEVRVRRLTPPEALWRLGDYLAHMGPERAAEAGEHFRAALDLEPGHPGALAGLAFLKNQEGKLEEAGALYEKALASGADDTITHLLYGENLLFRHPDAAGGRIEPGAELPPTMAAAREHLRRAIEQSPGLGRAYALFGYTYLYDPGDVQPGIAALRKARALLPRSEETAYSLLLLYLRSGDRESARGAEQSLVRMKADAEILGLAREAILRDELKDLERMVQEGRIEDAQAVMKRIRDATSDDELRARLDDAIARNAAAIRYNQAVDRVRKGDLAGAEDDLSKLLPEIRDPEMLEEARRLLEKIRAVKESPGK